MMLTDNCTPLFFERSAKLLQHIGKNSFYTEMIKFIAALIRCDMWLVIRYSHHAKPEFVINNAMTQEAKDFYSAGLYQLDPLFHITRTNTVDDVLVLSRLDNKGVYSDYLDKIMESADIKDEIAILVNAPEQINVVYTLNCSRNDFSDNDISVIRSALSFITELHRHHFSTVFSQAIYSEAKAKDRQQTIKLEDTASNPVYKSAACLDLEGREGWPFISKNDVPSIASCDVLDCSSQYTLRWETMKECFAIAPLGRMYTLEKDVNEPSKDKMILFFSRAYKLTPREKEIVHFVLHGYPNSLIANKLILSIGTIKNHRHRLYYKLDITSERELFSMFITYLLQPELKLLDQ